MKITRFDGFIPNNIALREVCARVQTEYLKSKVDSLHRLQCLNTHEFSPTAREIVAVKYDLWFQWLQEIELLLRRDTENIAELIIQISDRIEKQYEMIMDNHTEHFDAQYVNIWKECHTYMYQYLRTKILKLTDLDRSRFMIEVGKVLIAVMDNTIYEVHEIDSLINGGNVFVSFHDICYDFNRICNNNHCLIITRLNTYEKCFDIDKENVTIKDYTVGQDLVLNGKLPAFGMKAMAKYGYKIKEIV